MNLQQNIRILKGIAKKISNKLHCDRHGSCVHFAEIFVEEVNDKHPELLNDFDVIEGYVNAKFGDGIPQEHTWIRLNNGDIIDPTFSQFDKYDKNAQYSKKRTKVYSGQEYYNEGKEGSWFSERRKKLPSSVFKEGKRESIKRILKEESLKQSLIDMIKDGDFNFAVDIVGEDEFKRILNIETPIDYLHLFDDMEVVKSKKDSDFQLFRYKNQENLMVYHIPTRIVFVSYQLFKNVLFFTEGKDDITRETETSVLSYLKQWMNEVYRLKYVVGVNAMPNKYKIMEGHSKENVLKEETNIKPVLHNLLNMLFEGFDDIYYDWAEYNCGMGVCCDPYAIGFVLPGSEYDDYFFKFVEGNNYDFMGEYPKEITDELPEVCYEQPDIKDPRFDTIVFYEVFAEDIENYLGPQNNWKESLLNLINDKFGCRAWDLIII